MSKVSKFAGNQRLRGMSRMEFFFSVGFIGAIVPKRVQIDPKGLRDLEGLSTTTPPGVNRLGKQSTGALLLSGELAAFEFSSQPLEHFLESGVRVDGRELHR